MILGYWTRDKDVHYLKNINSKLILYYYEQYQYHIRGHYRNNLPLTAVADNVKEFNRKLNKIIKGLKIKIITILPDDKRLNLL